MSVDVGALASAASAALVGGMALAQSVRSDRRADQRAARQQHRLIVGAYMALWHWAQRVPLDTPAGPPPEPPDDLDLSPWL
ncbi:hypothetical protein [Kitasatospora cineracea]|uniref:hypothetical protein n=1 Tax=Kitasatospora cineracea TaxID=88074 RepID=UPI00379226AC